jgi:acyl-coenzyme A synthetase/AMP-(fatty) acid ligase
MPRPLLIVEALPRTPAGKLPLSALEAALRHYQQDI